MKLHYILFLTLFLLICKPALTAQLKNLVVETYYITDSVDAADFTNNILPVGSKTYRIYIELEKGSKLISILGKENSPIVINSSRNFFNHPSEGVSLSKDLNKSRFSTGTLPLDSWLTIDAVGKPFSGILYRGILKSKDIDGSVIGGENNDGGNNSIPGGLLTNQNALLGIPLTIADGLTTMPNPGVNWQVQGLYDPITGEDQSVFANDTTTWSSNNFQLITTNTQFLEDTSTMILIAQLTTDGDLSIQLNIEVETSAANGSQRLIYISTNNPKSQNEKFSPLLIYPQICGCKDPNYLESDERFACTDNSKCKTLAVIGCMDTLACNFNSKANINLASLCCYVGYCNDRDIAIICPDLPVRSLDEKEIIVFPNPASDIIQLKDKNGSLVYLRYEMYDSIGNLVKKGFASSEIDVIEMKRGFYTLLLSSDDESSQFYTSFIKI